MSLFCKQNNKTYIFYRENKNNISHQLKKLFWKLLSELFFQI